MHDEYDKDYYNKDYGNVICNIIEGVEIKGLKEIPMNKINIKQLFIKDNEIDENNVIKFCRKTIKELKLVYGRYNDLDELYLKFAIMRNLQEMFNV